MAFPIVAVLISTGISFALGQLRPRVKKPKPQDLEGWKAEEGRVLDYLAGIGAVEGNVTWWGDVKKYPHNDGIVTQYHGNLVMRLCQGPITQILDLQAGGKSIRFQVPGRDQDASHVATTVISPALAYPAENPSTPWPADVVEFTINARQMFGGNDREGGLEGRLRVYRGSLSQTVIDELAGHSWAAAALEATGGSAYPGACYAAFGEFPDADASFYLGTIAQPKPFVWILTRYPRALLDRNLGTTYVNAFSGQVLTYTQPTIGFDSNPAEILYELALDPRLGLGMAADSLDLPSLVRGGALWQAEGFGQSVHLARKEEGKAIVDELLKALNATFTPHPTTGLLTLTPLRGDYAVGSLLTVTDNPGVSNAWDLEEVTPLAGDSHNEIQLNYRRFAGGVAGPVVSEPFGPLSFFINVALYQTKGRNLSDVVVRVGSTTLTPGVDYEVKAPQGVVIIGKNATTTPLIGDLVVVDYVSNPETMRFEEAHVTESLLGEQLILGDVRPLELEAPYTTADLVAGKIAARLKQAEARQPRQYRWKMNRQGYALYPGAVCKITSSRLGVAGLPVRVGDVDQGRLEAPAIEVIAVEDIFAEDLLPSLPPAGGGPDGARPQAPPMGIGCGLGGVDVSRIALFRTDAAYAVEVWEADDGAGSGATLVATLDAGEAYYDGTVGKYYAARQIRPGLVEPGPFTAWITCVDDPATEEPVCVEPTWIAVVAPAAGTVALDAFSDPQNRVRGVEWRVQSGSSPWSPWALDTAPYDQAVILVAGQESFIQLRVTYQSCDGSDVVVERTFAFGQAGPITYLTGDPEPSLPGSLQAIPDPAAPGITVRQDTTDPAARQFLIGLDPFSAPDLGVQQFRDDVDLLLVPARYANVTEEGMALAPEVGASKRYDNQGVTYARCEVTVSLSTLPVGTRVGVKGWDGSAWRFLDDAETGPVVAVDPDSLAAADGADGILAGEDVLLADWARNDVAHQAFLVGGDGGSGLIDIEGLSYQPLVGAPDIPAEPEEPDPPDEDPGSCDVPATLDDFSYANFAAFDAAWPEV